MRINVAKGVLGGLFNALLAPLLFNSVAEYSVALVLACLLLPPIDPESKVRLGRFFPGSWAKPVGIVVDVGLAATVGAVACILFGSFVSTHAGVTAQAAVGGQITPPVQWIKEHLQVNLAGVDKALAFGLVALLCYSCSKRRVRFGLALGGFMLAPAYYDAPPPNELQLLCQNEAFSAFIRFNTSLRHRRTTCCTEPPYTASRPANLERNPNH